MKNVFLTLTAAAVIGLSSSKAISGEIPRAKVKEMSAVLQLPDGDELHVQVFQNCVPGTRNVGALLFSNQQVETFARAFDALYGPGPGAQLRDTWNRIQPDAVRGMTYIAIFDNEIVPEETTVNSKTSSNYYGKTTTNTNVVSETSSSDDVPSDPPVFAGGCNQTIHPPFNSK